MNAQPNTTDLDRLEALAKAATPGKWELQVVEEGRIRHLCPASTDGVSILTVVEQDGTPFGAVYDDNDAAFIAAANPATILELIQLARRSQPVAATQQAAEPVGEVIRFAGDRDLKEVAWRKGKLPPVGTKLYAAPVIAQQSEAGARPELTVWYGAMPESNGKSNFTAILKRKGAGPFDTCHITIDRSEYPDRVRYEADRVRWIIGELAEEPFILDYDADKHSGYVKPEAGRESAAPGAEQDAKDAARYRYLRETTKAIRNDEGTERIECTPEVFDASVDAGIVKRAAMQKGAQHG